MNSDDVKREPNSPESGHVPHVPNSSGDDGAGDGALRILRAAAGALRSEEGRAVQARIPLEQLERELLRVMHIELASILVRARDLARQLRAGDNALLEVPIVHALQCEARESIDVARACGVRVPRCARRLLSGGPATWPSAARLERWARRLDPDVELGAGICATETGDRDVLSR